MVIDRKEINKNYYEKNKEKERLRAKKNYEKNKEHMLEQKKDYKKNNKEKLKEYSKIYYSTEEGKKKQRINCWKYKGVKEDNWDILYDIYMNTWNCDICNEPLIEGNETKNDKCLDHDHQTCYYRGILCRECNSRDDAGL